MKKILCLLIASTLVTTFMLVSCDKEDQPGDEQNELTSESVIIPTEPSEGLEFRSNGDGTCALIGIGTCTDTYVVIPDTSPAGDSVTTIGDRAFAECDALTDIVIPEGVESIGYGLVDGCDNLQSISLPSTLMSIGNRSTMNLGAAPSLERITVDPGNSIYQSIDNCLIERSTGTMIAGCKTSVIPNTVTNLGSFTFAGCAGLTSIAIPNSVTSIGDFAFAGCTSLTSITIPDSVTYIGAAVFEECSDLDSINVDSGNKVYHSINNCIIESKSGELVFGGNHCTIPDGVTSIGSWAFSGADITNIEIPEGVRSIGNGAFFNCGELKSVALPNSLKVIGVQAFSECASLTDLTIPDSVTFIGDDAFGNCSGLTNICIPSSIEDIGYGAFWGCNNFTSISVSTGNNFYRSVDNCLIETESGILIQGCNNSIIPDSVLDIGDGAFYGCVDIININIPSSVTRIGDISFAGCTGLTSVMITDSVVSIGGGAFAECTALKDVYYTGTEQEWMAISIGSDNELLQTATIHYNYIP